MYVSQNVKRLAKQRKRLTQEGSRSMMKAIIDKAGIVVNENEWLTHHSFREAIQHTLQKAGVCRHIIEKLMGHYTESQHNGKT